MEFLSRRPVCWQLDYSDSLAEKNTNSLTNYKPLKPNGRCSCLVEE